jgi:hypothetical protein
VKKKRGRKPVPTLFVDKANLEKIWDKLPDGMDTRIKPSGKELPIKGKHLMSLVEWMAANRRGRMTPNRAVEALFETGINRNYARRVVATAINIGAVQPIP